MSDIEVMPPIPDVAIKRLTPDAVADSLEALSKQDDPEPPLVEQPVPGKIPEAMKSATVTSNRVQFTRASMRDVVHATAHMLAYFSDKEHPGLREPQHRHRQVPGTGVLVQPRLGGVENVVGFQFFYSDNTVAGHDVNKAVGIAFDFEVYESIGDRYMFNILKKLSEVVRNSKRPSDDQLKQLATRFQLSN